MFTRFAAPVDQVGQYIDAFEFHRAYEALEKLMARPQPLAAAAGAAATEEKSQLLNTRGWLHLQLNRPVQAVADCEDARRLNPNLDQNNLMLARLANEYQDSVIKPEMEKLKTQLSAGACHNIAMAYYQTGFAAHAASYFAIAILAADQSQLSELYNDLSGAYLEGGLCLEAFEAATRAIALNPAIDWTNYTVALDQIRALGQDPRPFAADPATVPAAGAGPSPSPSPPADLSQLDPLVAAAQQKHAANPNDSAATGELITLLIARARCYMSLHRFAEAVADYLAARRLDVYLGQAELRLAQFFKDKYDSLLKPLFDKERTEGVSAETYNEIGLCFFQNGFHSQAATYFRLAASIAEQLVKAESLNNLAGAYLEAGYVVDALRASAQAIALNPSISRVTHDLAVARFKPMGLDEQFLLRDRFAEARGQH